MVTGIQKGEREEALRAVLVDARYALERIATDKAVGDGPRSIAYEELKHIDAALSKDTA